MTISFKTMVLGAAAAALVALPMVGAAEAKPGVKRGEREVVFVERTGPEPGRRVMGVSFRGVNRRGPGTSGARR